MNSPVGLIGFAEIAEDCYHESGTVQVDMHGWRRLPDETGSEVDNFYARAYRYKLTDIIAIAYRGTANKKDIFAADAAGIGLSLNALAMNVEPALEFAGTWSAKTKDVWLVGHSLGGAYVQMVAAARKMPGITFNAPGVLHLLNQMSNRTLTRYVGSVLNPAMQLMTMSLGRADLLEFFSKALAADDDLPFAAVTNYRAQNDPVSLMGVQIGTPANVIQVDGSLSKIHRMSTIVEALGGKICSDDVVRF